MLISQPKCKIICKVCKERHTSQTGHLCEEDNAKEKDRGREPMTGEQKIQSPERNLRANHETGLTGNRATLEGGSRHRRCHHHKDPGKFDMPATVLHASKILEFGSYG